MVVINIYDDSENHVKSEAYIYGSHSINLLWTIYLKFKMQLDRTIPKRNLIILTLFYAQVYVSYFLSYREIL